MFGGLGRHQYRQSRARLRAATVKGKIIGLRPENYDDNRSRATFCVTLHRSPTRGPKAVEVLPDRDNFRQNGRAENILWEAIFLSWLGVTISSLVQVCLSNLG